MNRVLIIVVAMALCACAVARGPDSPRVLRLSPEFPAVSTPRDAGSLAVAPVQGRGLAGQRRYVYVDRAAPAELRQAASLFWEEPPPAVLQRALIGALRGRFSTVVGPEAGVGADRRVVARLDRFEEENGGGRQARAVVAFEVVVIAPSARKPSFGGYYCVGAMIADGASSSRARAFEQALAAAAAAFAADLATGAHSRTSCEASSGAPSAPI